MNRKILLFIAMVVVINVYSVDAQAPMTLNYNRYQCEELKIRDSSQRLVDLTQRFDSAQVIVFAGAAAGMGAVTISFNDGSLPVIFSFDGSSMQKLPDGSWIFYDADKLDPESLYSADSGYSVTLAERNGKTVILVMKGVVTYVLLTLRS